MKDSTEHTNLNTHPGPSCWNIRSRSHSAEMDPDAPTPEGLDQKCATKQRKTEKGQKGLDVQGGLISSLLWRPRKRSVSLACGFCVANRVRRLECASARKDDLEGRRMSDAVNGIYCIMIHPHHQQQHQQPRHQPGNHVSLLTKYWST